LAKLETRAAELVCTAGSTMPTAACSNIRKLERTGSAACGHFADAFPWPIFSGIWPSRIAADLFRRLGVLAGDHIKSASDLDIPLVGVGLFYGQDTSGTRWTAMAGNMKRISSRCQPAAYGNGHREKRLPVLVQIDTRAGPFVAKVWRVKSVDVICFLLDSDVEGNHPEAGMTSRLYGGDSRIRIRQELLLGVGGLRALRALGIQPGVLHLNEGHADSLC